MDMISILSCSNDLGSCCQSSELAIFLKLINTFISIIQVVVPIILLVMLCINLGQLVINPDDKKKEKQILNKFIAAAMVFFIPILLNLTMSILSSGMNTKVNFIACLEESKNIKVNSGGKYIAKDNNSNKKRTKVYTDESDYKGKSNTNWGSSTGSVGEKISSGEALIGDRGVKVRENIYHKKAMLTRKLNPQDVIAYAKSWKGKLSYSHGTTADLRPGGTCDCSQFVYQVLKHFDAVKSEAPSIYCSMWGSGNVKGTILYSDISKIQPGDVVYKYYSKYAQHVEIYLGNNRSIGCNGGKGVNEGGNVNKYFETFIHLTAYD